MLKQLPFILVYSRLPADALIILLAWSVPAYYREWIVVLMVYGLVSDFFDGFIARRVGASTEKLRRLDSGIDQFFWVSVIAATIIITPEFYKEHIWQVSALALAEALAYVISYIRFRKEVATHAIASKFWVLTLLFTFVQLVLYGWSGWVFQLCFWVGIVTRLEIIGILLLIKEWVNDVPSIYHAVQLRKGKPIKRNKLFNG